MERLILNKLLECKKIYIGALIGIICIVLLFFVPLSSGRGGGEIGFDAEIVSVEGNWITAEVTNDMASFLSKKLPNVIGFDSTVSGVSDLKPGDYIHADYLSGTIDGNQVKVVSIAVWYVEQTEYPILAN